MIHSAKGYWLEEAGPVESVRPSAEGRLAADVVIVGGGYLGMWTAWHISAAAPEARIVLLERDICGEGPSGRNGGIANPLWDQLPTLIGRFGEQQAMAVAESSAASVEALGAWARDHGVDCWYRPGPLLEVSTAPAQDGAWHAATEAARKLGRGDNYRELSQGEVADLCPTPIFRGGALLGPSATVQPARLARGLRTQLIERGIEIYERSPVTALDRMDTGCLAKTATASVRASAGVLAVNARLAGWQRFHRRLSVTSSHMIITEPVPDFLEELGWLDGPPVVDHQTLLHYFRPTADFRVALGWGGGPMAYGGRISNRLEIDKASVAEAISALTRIFPQLVGRKITHAWGGPIDVSPIHVPIFGSDHAIAYGYGFTGNGIAPAHLGGRILADLALDRRTDLSRLPLVDPADLPRFPPEPLRWIGGSLVRRALIRRERAAAAGRTTDPLTRFVAGLPSRLGLNLPR